MSPPIRDVRCRDERYRVIVQPYLFGQLRLQLLDTSRPYGDNIVILSS